MFARETAVVVVQPTRFLARHETFAEKQQMPYVLFHVLNAFNLATCRLHASSRVNNLDVIYTPAVR
jgi:hypothetical protein